MDIYSQNGIKSVKPHHKNSRYTASGIFRLKLCRDDIWSAEFPIYNNETGIIKKKGESDGNTWSTKNDAFGLAGDSSVSSFLRRL